MQNLQYKSHVMIRRPLLILFFIAPFLTSASHDQRPGTHTRIPEHPFPNSQFITVDSVRLHYRTWNDSLAHPRGKVFFIHGFSGSTFCFRKNIEPLVKAGFVVVAADLPCFGYSERDPQLNQSQSNRARLLWLLLNAIDGSDTTRWNLVGHSMGGGTAEAMAILEPGRTKTLTIVDGMVFSKNKNLTGAVGMVARNKEINRVLVSFTDKNILTYNNMRRLLKSAYGQPPDSSAVIGYLVPLQIEGTAEAIWGVWTHAKEKVKMDARAIHSMPVLVVWGSKDHWIRKSYANAFMKDIPTATMKIIPGAGHIPIETHSEAFNGLLLSFLTGNN